MNAGIEILKLSVLAEMKDDVLPRLHKRLKQLTIELSAKNKLHRDTFCCASSPWLS